MIIASKGGDDVSGHVLVVFYQQQNRFFFSVSLAITVSSGISCFVRRQPGRGQQHEWGLAGPTEIYNKLRAFTGDTSNCQSALHERYQFAHQRQALYRSRLFRRLAGQKPEKNGRRSAATYRPRYPGRYCGHRSKSIRYLVVARVKPLRNIRQF